MCGAGGPGGASVGGAIGGGGAGGGSGDTAAGENDDGASGDCAMEIEIIFVIAIEIRFLISNFWIIHRLLL